MTRYRLAVFAVAGSLLLLTGCTSMREIAGVAVKGDPSVTLRSAETRWLLIQNPRYGDVASEPEYVWVEEDKVPTTLKTLVRGQGSIIAPPEIVAKYGTPPGGGKISPRQGVPTLAAAVEPRPASPLARGAAVRGTTAASVSNAQPAKRGYVVYVDTTRIVIDLASADGVRAGTMVSLRRDRVPLVHPVTGEVLGDLDEEVGTARVTETRDKFSVAEIQSVTPGAQIQIKDRAVLR
ncbi:MAG: hypothetical protein HY216_13420 [Candidatus Rokubacteria bacterium]|nr:hypothetical protein [Candidatus Rokubacteria bacterium]